MSKVSIAFFDFDGTITKKDSLRDFIKYSVGRQRYFMGLIKLSPILLGYLFRFISNNTAKEKFVTHFFGECLVTKFQNIADKYSIEEIDKIVFPKAMEKIKWHKEMGHSVTIVTASLDIYLKSWCEKHNIGLIATQLEVKHGIITGKFATKNCYGIEKVKRIKKRYDLSIFELTYAYGNSKGDKEMLNIADKFYYKYFE